MLWKWEICVFRSYYIPILFGAKKGIWTMSDISRLLSAEMRFLRCIERKARRGETRNGKNRENFKMKADI
jgi:hypothetical protein